jgi:hypothetical protein
MRPQGLGLEVVNNGSQNLPCQIEATGRQIDALLYELYELTEGDIGIVEGTYWAKWVSMICTRREKQTIEDRS